MKILIQNQAYEKLKAYVVLVDTEISGMAKSEIDEDKNIIINDFIIFEQEVTGATTEISDKSQAVFLNELMKANEDPAKWNIWWHSHADMGVNWSAKDDKTIEEHTSQSYLISLLVNKKMEMVARLDIFPKDLSPFNKATYCKFDIPAKDIEVIKTQEEIEACEQYDKELKRIEKELNKQIELADKKYKSKVKTIEKFCKKEIDKKVKEKKYDLAPITTYDYNEFAGYSRPYQPRRYHFEHKLKKWSWLDGQNKFNDNMYDDLCNHQQPLTL